MEQVGSDSSLGGVVTTLKQQVKDQNRVNVFIGGKYALSLSVRQVVDLGVKVGKLLGPDDVKVLKKASADGKAEQRALEWVLTRPRSIREFHDYCRRKKTEPDFTSKMTDAFLSRGYLDELRFAEWLSELRYRKKRSTKQIQYELRSKGVVQEVIAKVLQKDSKTSVRQIATKLQNKSSYRNDQSKLFRYLCQKGYDYSLVREVLAELYDGSGDS